MDLLSIIIQDVHIYLTRQPALQSFIQAPTAKAGEYIYFASNIKVRRVSITNNNTINFV